MSKNDVIVQAVIDMKAGQFKATAIKVELEASLRREYAGDTGAGCNECDEGYIRCGRCYEGCDDCEEGYYRCDEGCEGWGNPRFCHNWLMEKLSHIGLAEPGQSTVSGLWKPAGALVYAKFYNDGSVDSEFTFTILLDNPENILLLPKIIDIWNDFTKAVGNKVEIGGAGMHMAMLDSPGGIYPAPSTDDRIRLYNFSRSMQLLLPALYFLGSSNDKSRGLGYRNPEVGYETHRSAIDYRNGALEFRVFETCYDTPEVILDNVVVISNALGFWRTRYKRHNLRKIANDIRFGVDGSNELKRFYIIEEHVALLNAGLKVLKPSYYTVRELKKQRKFTVTRAHCKNSEKKAKLDAEIEYKEYEDRFEWTILTRRDRIRADLIETYTQRTSHEVRMLADRDEIVRGIEPEVEKRMQDYIKTKKSTNKYVQEKIDLFKRRNVGSYRLHES